MGDPASDFCECLFILDKGLFLDDLSFVLIQDERPSSG
jgi:hypothetical protein